MVHQQSADPNQQRAQPMAMAVVAVVAGGLVGVAAGAVQASGWALLVIQSLAAGWLLAVVLVGAASSLALRRPSWRAAVVAALVAVVVQHIWLYSVAIDARREAAARQPAVELFRPGWSDESFFSYIQSVASPANVAAWTLDAVLLTWAAVTMVECSRRRTSSTAGDG